MNVIIRKASPSDIEPVYALICDLEDLLMDRNNFEDIYYRNLTNPDIHYLLAEFDNLVVGFISIHIQHLLHHSKSTCEIQEIIINSEFRGSRIGEQLINEAERIAKELNLEEIEITTKIHRERAQAFYHKMGYAHTHKKFVKKLI